MNITEEQALKFAESFMPNRGLLKYPHVFNTVEKSGYLLADTKQLVFLLSQKREFEDEVEFLFSDNNSTLKLRNSCPRIDITEDVQTFLSSSSDR